MPLFGHLLGSLASPPVGRNRRISSNEQPHWNDSNFDMTVLLPGAVFELPTLEGPGCITHLWMTSHAGGVGELNALTLRIYWDGRAEPGVEAPLGEFFAVGQGQPAVVESVPVQVSPTGSLTGYWPMPFRESARIVVSNDNPDRTSGLYWQVDWLQLESLPPDTPYFHARYRQEYPAARGRDYLLADLEGSGKFVGAVLSVTLAQDGWFGEGDDFFFIDGETVPSLQGTGTEDYFNDAWGFRPRTSAWFGQPRWQGHRAGDSGVCYRWHLLDPVHFEQSLRVTLEHKGNHPLSEDGWFIERPDYFNSVAFWYQHGLPKPFGGVPAWPERRVPWERHHLVRAFRSAQSVLGNLDVRTVGFFGGRPALHWTPGAQEASLSLPFSTVGGERCALRLTAFAGPESGTFAVLLDGETVLPCVDLSGAFREEDLLLGTRALTPGAHRLTFRPVGAPRSLELEELRLLALPPAATRPVKTHNEAHFIRLGIGRAAYAYRLAYGQLPDSLETLATSGLMPERFLRDENERPLVSRRDGDFLIVEAPAWTHRWQGLDARR